MRNSEIDASEYFLLTLVSALERKPGQHNIVNRLQLPIILYGYVPRRASSVLGETPALQNIH